MGALAAIMAVAIVLGSRTPDAAAVSEAPASPGAAFPAPKPAVLGPTAAPSPSNRPARAADPVPVGEPRTMSFRSLSEATAVAVYSWDTRTATYSQNYAKLRSWWHLLPDGSNPLTVFAQQFEATGINAAAYASLTGEQGYRSAQAVNTSCDGELSQYQQQPPPWAGLHVCTVTLAVTEHAASGSNSYTAPLSVVVNCPPAPTASPDSCDVVAFYAASDRIVY